MTAAAPRFAGMSGHQSARARTQEWLTPPEILAALGPFDLDPCAPAVRPWSTADRHLTIADNGLLQSWEGRVWLNPPYGRATARWMGRMAEHGCGTALIFARTETDAWFRFVWPIADGVLFLRGRLNFYRPDGTLLLRPDGGPANAGAPSALIGYGADDAAVLERCGLSGRYVALRPRLTVTVLLPDDRQTWRELIGALLERRGEVGLAELYLLVEPAASRRGNRHWRDKVRQIVQRSPFQRVGRGIYRLAA